MKTGVSLRWAPNLGLALNRFGGLGRNLSKRTQNTQFVDQLTQPAAWRQPVERDSTLAWAGPQAIAAAMSVGKTSCRLNGC